MSVETVDLKNYTRLTKQEKLIAITTLKPIYSGKPSEYALYNRLAELEDRIEDGTLVESSEVLSQQELKETRQEAIKEFIQEICKELWDIRITPDRKMIECGDITSIDLWRIAKNKFGIEVKND